MIHIHTEAFPVISYRKWGHGPAIVLLHGFPENGDLWRNIWPVLANSFTVLVPDMPGAGESTYTGKQVSVEQLADSINYILENEHIEEAVIAGHSMGGYVALAFADKYAGKVKGISMVHSTATPDTDEKKEIRRKLIELIRKGGREPFIKQMVPNLFSTAYKKAYPDDVVKQIERGLQLSADTMIAYYEAMMNRPDRKNVLTGATFPVQWLLGNDDNAIPLQSTLQQAHLCWVNFVSIYDCGHLGMLEQPVNMFADIKDFTTYCYSKNL